MPNPEEEGQGLRWNAHTGRRCWRATPLGLQEGHPRPIVSRPHPPVPREMDYSDYSHPPSHRSRSSPQRVWPQQSPQQQQPVPFPSPVSPGTTYFFPAQTSQQQQPGAPQTSPSTASRPTPAGLSLNLSGLSVASPPSPHQAQPGQLHPHQLHAHHPLPHQPHHTHSHSHSSGSSISPMTPVSPPSMPHIAQFSYNFDDPIPSSGGLSPTPDVHSQRRPSTGSHSASSSELAPEKSVPRKRSLTNTLPVTSVGSAAHNMHQHSQSHPYASSHTQAAHHALPHPIITTTASSPPLPTSSASSPSHSHSRSHSHSHSHSSLSQSHSPQRSHPQPDATSPCDELDSSGTPFTPLGDDPSDDDSVSPSGSFSASGPFGEYPFPFLIRSSPVLTTWQPLSSRQCETIRVVEPTGAEPDGQVCRHQ